MPKILFALLASFCAFSLDVRPKQNEQHSLLAVLQRCLCDGGRFLLASGTLMSAVASTPEVLPVPKRLGIDNEQDLVRGHQRGG
jgi:hypothetical protein